MMVILLNDGIAFLLLGDGPLDGRPVWLVILDIEVVDLARRIPWDLKLRGGQTKWILKEALAPLLPREIIDRKKKGFGMPIGRWLREGKFDFDHTHSFPHLDVAFAERQHSAHMAGTRDERLFLWSYWLLGQWLRK